MENEIINSSAERTEVNPSLQAVNAKTDFVEIGGRKIAYRSIGKGLPIILINRFRGNLDTWDPAFLDALALRFNVITMDYSGTGLSTGTCAADVFSKTDSLLKTND